MAFLRTFHPLRWLFLLLCALVASGPAFAQASGEQTTPESVEEQLDLAPEVEQPSALPGDAELPRDRQPLGVVREIVVTGLPTVRDSVIIRQLTFELGDTLTDYHRSLSVRRLWQLRLFWRVAVNYRVIEETPADGPAELEPGEPAEAEAEVVPDEDAPLAAPDPESEGTLDEAVEQSQAAPPSGKPGTRNPGPDPTNPDRPLRVEVEVFQGNSLFAYPYFINGGVFGDRDAWQTGDTISAGTLIVDEFRYHTLQWEDPQFGGGHHRAGFTLSMSDAPVSVRTERNSNTGESYDLNKLGLNFRYNTTFGEEMTAWWGAEVAQTETTRRSGATLGDKEFLLSEADFPDGLITYVSAGIGRNEAKGYPLTYGGYYWTLSTEQSLRPLGSIRNYGLYHLNAAKFFSLSKSRPDTIGIRVKFDTSTGDPPHYELPVGANYVRAYTGVAYLNRSALNINVEARFTVHPDYGQVVLFYDLGKGFDDRIPSFKDLEYSYGVGLRIRTKTFFPVDYLVQADYAWGPSDTRYLIGVGQWF